MSGSCRLGFDGLAVGPSIQAPGGAAEGFEGLTQTVNPASGGRCGRQRRGRDRKVYGSSVQNLTVGDPLAEPSIRQRDKTENYRGRVVD